MFLSIASRQYRWYRYQYRYILNRKVTLFYLSRTKLFMNVAPYLLNQVTAWQTGKSEEVEEQSVQRRMGREDCVHGYSYSLINLLLLVLIWYRYQPWDQYHWYLDWSTHHYRNLFLATPTTRMFSRSQHLRLRDLICDEISEPLRLPGNHRRRNRGGDSGPSYCLRD